VRITQDYSRTDDLYKEYHRGPVGSAEKFWNKFRKYIGFSTDQEKRRKLYGEVFTTALRLSADKLRCGELIDQILNLVEKNGRIDHKASGHDDLVISWLLAMWLLLLGNNLGHYEINNSRLMMRNRNLAENREGVDEELQFEEEARQQKLMGEIEQLVRTTHGLLDPVQAMAARNRLQALISQLNTDTQNVASMESLRELLQRQRMK
ncbi:TPA: hypothetical protein ACQFDA_004662, partial [Escherichia coli]